MIGLNVKFQEEYKRLDALCKDIFSSNDGVSRYIYEMENTYSQYIRLIFNWDSVYKQLKHLRWIRNQLAHEIGAFEVALCTEDDIEWLTDFYNSILERTDPLAKLSQIELQFKKQQIHIKTQSNPDTVIQTNKQKTSLWSKIKEKIKTWLS